MTDFAVPALRAAAPLVSKEKGSIGNRLDCAGQQLKNDVVTLAQTGATVGGAALAGAGISKSDKVANAFAKTYDKGVKLLEKAFGPKVGNRAHALEQKLNDIVGTYLNGQTKTTANTKNVKGAILSGGVVKKIKGFAALTAITLPVLAYITHKGSYKSGQIDQKYTDRAQTQTLAK